MYFLLPRNKLLMYFLLSVNNLRNLPFTDPGRSLSQFCHIKANYSTAGQFEAAIMQCFSTFTA